MCFRVAIIRITDHFVFQGVEGAEAAAGIPRVPNGFCHSRTGVCTFRDLIVILEEVSAISGFWWVLVGFGGFWLKTTPLKSLKFIVKNSVLGSGGCKMERKWTLKMHFFGVLKSYEFIVKSRVWAG